MNANTACILTFALVLAFPLTPATGGETPDLHTVTVRGIELRVPKNWKQKKTTSRMRLAQFEIPGKESEQEPAELVIFYFGGATGGIKANIQRWIGLFQEAGRTVELRRGNSEQGEYVLADIAGTWKKPVGPPIAQRTVEKPGSRVIGVILIAQAESDKDYYFLKLSGPDTLVKSQTKSLRVALAARADSEKPFELEDAEN